MREDRLSGGLMSDSLHAALLVHGRRLVNCLLQCAYLTLCLALGIGAPLQWRRLSLEMRKNVPIPMACKAAREEKYEVWLDTHPSEATGPGL